jgi:phage terminase large subunit-like protein
MPKPFTPEHFKAWAHDLILDSGEPWEVEDFQLDFLADVFHGYSECWLVVPEGNAKTTLVAGLVLYHIEFAPNADVTVAASSRDQAEILYRAAAEFVYRSPGLLDRFRPYDGYRRIIYRANRSRIQIFAADDRTGDGIKPTMAVMEELHRHRHLDLYRTWRGKLEKRGGQIIAISTAGEPEGEFEEVRKAMRDQATETTRRECFLRATSPTTVLHEYAVPEDEDPEDLDLALQANPLKMINRATLERKRSSPSWNLAHWRRFVLGQPSRMDTWIEPAVWDALKTDIGGIEEGDDVFLAVRVTQAGGCGVGIAAPKDDDRVAVACEMLPYDFPGLEFRLRQLDDRYKVRAMFGYAPQFGIGVDVMRDHGIPLEDLAQSPMRLMEATSTFRTLVAAHRLSHDGDPVLRKQVMAGMVKEAPTGSYLTPTKEVQGLVAVILAADQATQWSPRPLVLLPSGSVG